MEEGAHPDFLRKRYHTARKEYTCCECGNTISRWERYEYIVGVWDDEFYTFKTCKACDRMRKALQQWDHKFVILGSLQQGLTEARSYGFKTPPLFDLGAQAI